MGKGRERRGARMEEKGKGAECRPHLGPRIFEQLHDQIVLHRTSEIDRGLAKLDAALGAGGAREREGMVR